MVEYGYARVSSLDQDPQLQINALVRAGIHPDYIVQEKVSGVAAKRPVRDQLLATVKPGDRIVCWKLDRWGRSTADLLEVIQGLEDRRVGFKCLTQPLDTTSAFGKMQLTLLAAFAEFERTLLLERTAAGKARRQAEGLHPGGIALYGFEADHTTVIEAEANLIRYVADFTLEGAPMNQIVDVLNWRGFRTRSGSRWQVKTMVRILRNPYVIPILGQEVYDRLARLFNQPDRQSMGRPATALLSGILVCSRCGHPLYLVQIRQRSGAKRKVYACRKAGQGGRWAGCGSLTVSMVRADDYARELFVASVVGEPFREALAQRQAELLATEDVTAADLDAWRAEADELEQVMPTRYAPPNARERHAELRRMVDQATAKLLAQPALQELMSLPRSEQELRRTWESWSVGERRSWIKKLVEKIVVKPATTRSSASDVESRMVPIFKL
jgi:DNA invertase Pin-like site-specific DNA recombinase